MRISDWSSTCALPICLKFPTTKVFSELARKSLPEVDPRDCPDAALLAWMEREELLFRRLERHIVAERISRGFLAAGGADVDGFLGFSLSVQNRRTARAGKALETHLEAVFTALGELGRASCRDQVSQYVSISVVAVSLKK